MQKIDFIFVFHVGALDLKNLQDFNIGNPGAAHSRQASRSAGAL